METDLAVTPSRSQERLRTLRATLREIARQLTEREMEHKRIQGELARFQGRYYRTMGRLYAELDEVLARLAEKKAARSPWEDAPAARARRRRARAARSRDEYERWQSESADSPPPPPPPPSASAKKIYRKIAAELHPDLADDDEARRVRTRLMADLNAAYARGDIRGMEDILEAWRKSPEAVAEDDPDAEASRLERTIERSRDRLAHLDEQVRRLKSSPLHRLMLRSREASRQGRDLLAELAQDIERKIASARRELAEL